MPQSTSSPRKRQPDPRSAVRTGDGALFARCRHALQLTARELAALLQVHMRNLQRWEANAAPVPGAAWLALYFMLSLAGAARHRRVHEWVEHYELSRLVPLPPATRAWIAEQNRHSEKH